MGTRAARQGTLSQITALTSRNKGEPVARAKIPLSDLENGIVGWEWQEDPEMPLNFVSSRKWMILGLLSSITFVSPLASSMFAPAELTTPESGDTLRYPSDTFAHQSSPYQVQDDTECRLAVASIQRNHRIKLEWFVILSTISTEARSPRDLPGATDYAHAPDI